MTDHAASADGTRIAFDRLGDGPPTILVSGMLDARRESQPLAALLARDLTVLNYDRRGKGDSGDTSPYSPDREVADIAALIEAAGGTAAVYGHSSGAGLALLAAAAGLPITRLVLHEPPHGPGDDDSARHVRAIAASVRTDLATGDRPRTIERFLLATGAPAEAAQEIADDPGMQASAPTMPYDFEIMEAVGALRQEHLAHLTAVPTLILSGGASPDFFRTTAERLRALLPHARHRVLEGQAHEPLPEAIAPPVAEFLAS